MEKFNLFCSKCSEVKKQNEQDDDAICLICKMLNLSGRYIEYKTRTKLTELRLRFAEKKCFNEMSKLLTKGTYNEELFFNSDCIAGHLTFCPACYVREHLIDKGDNVLCEKLNNIYYEYIEEIKKCLSINWF